MSSNKFESKVNKLTDNSSETSSSDSSSDKLSDNPRIICHVISQNIPNRTFNQIINGNRRRNKKHRNLIPGNYLDQILKNLDYLTKNVDYNENKPKMVIDSQNGSILSRKKLNLDQFESEIIKNLSNKIIENMEEFIETNKLNEDNEESKDSSSSDTFEESSEISSSDEQEEPETINDEKLIKISNEIVENCKNKLRNYQYLFFGCLLVLILVSIFNSSH